MLDALKQMISSKKWLGAMLMIAIGILVNQKVITPDLGQTIEVALGIGIAGQAIADHGKSAAIVNAAASAQAPPAVISAPNPAPAPAAPVIEKVPA